MKIDAMSAAAVAFAGFAAWAYLKPKAPAKAAASDAFGMLKQQREQVGAATWQNLDYLSGPAYAVPDTSNWLK